MIHAHVHIYCEVYTRKDSSAVWASYYVEFKDWIQGILWHFIDATMIL